MINKKFLAGLILVFMFAGANQASALTGYFSIDWDEVTNFASDAWNSTADYVTGLFSGSEPESKDETLPPHLASNWDKLTG